jgi:DNA-binding NarL/FixJ family response regulator
VIEDEMIVAENIAAILKILEIFSVIQQTPLDEAIQIVSKETIDIIIATST